jgi:hypothetical protein
MDKSPEIQHLCGFQGFIFLP